MIEGLPIFIHVIFGFTLLLSIGWFSYATRSLKVLVFLLFWTFVQSVLAWQGVFQDATLMPPRIMIFGVLPALIIIALNFLTVRGRAFIDSINLKTLTYFHTIRVPVEIVLFLLCMQEIVSVYMTFEGTNFDILSGLSAPIVAYFAFRHGPVRKRLLVWWNVVCLLLLLNVVITAILALPTPFQIVSPEQPNVAVLYFPYSLLPTVIVPLVLFAHLVALRRLNKN